MKRFSFLAAFLLLLTGPITAFAQSSQSVTIVMQGEELGQLQGQKVAGTAVTGSATITAAGSGIRVTVRLSGLNPAQQSAGHIHTGKCGQQGNVIFPLNNISADASGAGSSDTTLPNVPYSEVTNGTYYVQYHIQVTPPGRQISCGNIIMPASAPANNPATPAMTTLPSTGSGLPSQEVFSSNGLLLILIGILALGGVGLYLTHNRKRRQRQ
jgi:hypothetical protein